MPRSEAAATSAPVWHKTGRHLWLGRSGDQDVAVIEKDGRYAAIDAAGRILRIFPTLLRAQVALAPALAGADPLPALATR